MNNRPLYYDVYNDLVKIIKGRQLAENAPLPSERSLCDYYHVSRTTIRKALELLEQENYIFRKQGSGTFVKPQVYEQPLVKFYSFADTLKEEGIVLRNTIVEYELIEAGNLLAEAIGCKEKDVFHRLTRLRSAADHPLMLETTYLPRNRFFRLDVDWLKDNSLYDYLSTNYNMRVDKSIEMLRPVNASAGERKLLKIPATLPCMAVERFNYEAGELIEYTKAIIRGDKYRFKAELAIMS